MASNEAVIACQAADVATSIIGYEQGLKEGNPAMAKVIAKVGVPGLIALKVAFVWVVLTYLDKEEHETARAAVSAIGCGTAIRNVVVIAK